MGTLYLLFLDCHFQSFRVQTYIKPKGKQFHLFLSSCASRLLFGVVDNRLVFLSWAVVLTFILCLIENFSLLYKHQWNTRWAFARKLGIFTCENNMLSSHVKISPLLWLHNKSRLSHQKTVKVKWFGSSLVYMINSKSFLIENFSQHSIVKLSRFFMVVFQSSSILLFIKILIFGL